MPQNVQNVLELWVHNFLILRSMSRHWSCRTSGLKKLKLIKVTFEEILVIGVCLWEDTKSTRWGKETCFTDLNRFTPLHFKWLSSCTGKRQKYLMSPPHNWWWGPKTLKTCADFVSQKCSLVLCGFKSSCFGSCDSMKPCNKTF